LGFGHEPLGFKMSGIQSNDGFQHFERNRILARA
jgi:hypothetical protein